MTRADRVLVVLALCTIALLYRHLWTDQGTANGLRIQVADAAATVTTLATDRHIQVAGPLGDSTIEIRAGKARFLSSPCPGQVCVHSGWLREAGHLAACLPNRISIQLLGSRPRFDAINF
jgi:hypothetical protein